MIKTPVSIWITFLVLLITGSSDLKAQQYGAKIHKGELIFGYFEGSSLKILFKSDQSFLYKDGNDKGHGIFENLSCVTTSIKTGAVLSQGNMLLTFDGLQCCYQIKLIGKNLAMSSVWKKGGRSYGRRFRLPGENPIRDCSTLVLTDKTRWKTREDDPPLRTEDGGILQEFYIITDDPYFRN